MSDILDKKILDMFIEHLSTVLECEANEDSDKTEKLDALRVKRHRALCEKLGLNYDSFGGNDKAKVTLYDFGQKTLDKYFDGDVVKAAKYAYRKFLDEKTKWTQDTIRTHYTSFTYLRSYYEELKEFAEAELADFKSELDERWNWWKSLNVYENQDLREELRSGGCTLDTVCTSHDFNGHSYAIRNKLKIFDRFTVDLEERDLTEANYDAYVFTRKQLDEFLGKIALEFRRQEKKFKEAKKIVEEWNASHKSK